MKQTLTLTTRVFALCLVYSFSVIPLSAQDGGGGEEPPIESDWTPANYSLYDKGDQTFNISLGVVLPMMFTRGLFGEKLDNMPGNLNAGGGGMLAYNYFLSAHLFVGGEIGGMFASTIGKNYLFVIPMGGRVGWQVWRGKFEFPASLMVGGASQSYLDHSFFDLFFKPQISGFYRFNSEWSFGLNLSWWIVFQGSGLFGPATNASGEDRSAVGHFFDATLSARYHF